MSDHLRDDYLIEEDRVREFAQCQTDIYAGETRKEYMARLREEGRMPVAPTNRELFIDIDSDKAYEEFRILLDILEREWAQPVITRETPSLSGLPHRHIVLKMPFEITDMERVAYQAALGSDRKRELLSLFRIQKGDEYPTLFAESKGDDGPNCGKDDDITSCEGCTDQECMNDYPGDEDDFFEQEADYNLGRMSEKDLRGDR